MTPIRDLIAELPTQLRWAADLEPPAVPEASEALVSGMGGSGIAGSIAAVIGEDCGARISVRKSYGLPGWVEAARPLLLAVSHSGNTEETLDAADAATLAGLPIAVVATGGSLASLAVDRGWPAVMAPQGPQPRAAVGYLAGGALRVLEAAGLLPPQAESLREAADVVDTLLGGGAGPGVALADDLGDAIAGRIAVIYGGEGAGAVAANRWKTQINENGKSPAWWSTLPELDHNEIVGWGGVPELSRDAIAVVSLHVPGEHPRVTLRSRITGELMEGVGIAGRVDAIGESLLAKLFSLIVIGDLVSVTVAERVGADPMPVDVIEDLKRRLAAEGR